MELFGINKSRVQTGVFVHLGRKHYFVSTSLLLNICHSYLCITEFCMKLTCIAIRYKHVYSLS